MKRKQRPMYIRVVVAIFFVALPQALIWLHKSGHHVAVVALASLATFILAFALLKVLLSIFVLSPEGFAMCMEQSKRKTNFVFVFGSIHIVYALYQVGWTTVAIVLLVFMGITESLSLFGRARLARMDDESKAKLWISTLKKIHEAEQAEDANPDHVSS